MPVIEQLTLVSHCYSVQNPWTRSGARRGTLCQVCHSVSGRQHCQFSGRQIKADAPQGEGGECVWIKAGPGVRILQEMCSSACHLPAFQVTVSCNLNAAGWASFKSLLAICRLSLPSSSQDAPVQDLWRKIEAIELSHLGQVRLTRLAQLSLLLAELSLSACRGAHTAACLPATQHGLCPT